MRYVTRRRCRPEGHQRRHGGRRQRPGDGEACGWEDHPGAHGRPRIGPIAPASRPSLPLQPAAAVGANRHEELLTRASVAQPCQPTALSRPDEGFKAGSRTGANCKRAVATRRGRGLRRRFDGRWMAAKDSRRGLTISGHKWENGRVVYLPTAHRVAGTGRDRGARAASGPQRRNPTANARQAGTSVNAPSTGYSLTSPSSRALHQLGILTFREAIRYVP